MSAVVAADPAAVRCAAVHELVASGTSDAPTMTSASTATGMARLAMVETLMSRSISYLPLAANAITRLMETNCHVIAVPCWRAAPKWRDERGGPEPDYVAAELRLEPRDPRAEPGPQELRDHHETESHGQEILALGEVLDDLAVGGVHGAEYLHAV